MSAERPELLIEDWLPVTELGIEAVRERAALHSLPPLSFLHVWWARRPLVASAAVVLAGLLPNWTKQLAAAYPDQPEVADENAYHKWLLHLVGIWGDPVAAQAAADAAKMTGLKMKANPFNYRQAYRNATPRADVDLLHRILIDTWGELPLVADPTAGGGSIPFVAARLGIPVYANDLNGVAAAVLRAGVEIPAEQGVELAAELRTWGRLLVDRIEERLRPFFPSGPGELVTNYIWVNAVRCPRTGRWVPLMNNKWLRKERGKEAAVRVRLSHLGHDLDVPSFEVVTGSAVDVTDADQGFVARGTGLSPYDNLTIDGAHIKSEAQAGRMRPLLYAVAIRKTDGTRAFRSPTKLDLDAVAAADAAFERIKAPAQSAGILPTEEIPAGLKTSEPIRYGMTSWLSMYTPRQALVHGTFVDEYQKLVPEIRAALGRRRVDGTGDFALADAVLAELALMQGKAVNYNSRLSFWHTPRQTMGNVFSKHDFAFMWTFAEMVGAGPSGSAVGVYGWALPQLYETYEKLAQLLQGSGVGSLEGAHPLPRSVRVTQGSAAELRDLADGSVAHVCMDPPYYDNVMYAELADFFYVWEKRTLGRILPGYFAEELTDKDNEAVANPARFEAMGKRKRELAELDYEAKMTAIFAECRRVLRDDGVMSVMFTHKRAEAWDTLGMGLLEAGFTIETSWPVNTEAEHSLHQANMNSAASTIMLVCRKREIRTGSKVFLDDIAGDVRAAARESLTRFRQHGIDGVDLLLSTYGPVLSVISEHWPVYSTHADETGKARLVRPEEALDIAREEVVRLQRARIVGRDTVIDDHTDFVLIAWETFKAAAFPFDEARRLALAVGGLDVDELAQAKVVEKKAGTVRLLSPKERVRRGGDDTSTGVRIDAGRFVYMNDALDTVLHIAKVDGMTAAKTFMDRLKLTSDPRFLATVQGMVNAMPRVKVKGEWVVEQAGLLDTLVTAHLHDVITLSAEPTEPIPIGTQGELFGADD